MWQRFNEHARKANFYAQEEAQRTGSTVLRPEHLLLGLLRHHESAALRVLRKLCVKPEVIVAHLTGKLPPPKAASRAEVSLTPLSNRIIDLSHDEATNLGNNYLGTEHLLLGLIRVGESLPAIVLQKFGVTLDKTSSIVREMHEGDEVFSTAGGPEHVSKTFASDSDIVQDEPEVLPRLLASAEDSALIVIDLQDSFLKGIQQRERVLRRSMFLIEVANVLGIPTVATEQYSTRMGDTNAEIAALLGEAPRYDKLCFSSLSCGELNGWWQNSGAQTAVIVGIETHICVTQTALEFASRDVAVHLCADAVGSRLGDAHEIAIARMRTAGVTITHTESVAYEWMKRAGTDEFKKVLELVKKYS